MKRNNAKSSIYIILSIVIILVILSVISYKKYKDNSKEPLNNGVDPVEITERFLRIKEQVNSV